MEEYIVSRVSGVKLDEFIQEFKNHLNSGPEGYEMLSYDMEKDPMIYVAIVVWKLRSSSNPPGPVFIKGKK